MANLQERPIWTRSFERAMLPGLGRQALNLGFDIDGAVLAPFGEEANEVRKMRFTGKKVSGKSNSFMICRFQAATFCSRSNISTPWPCCRW